MESAGRGEIDGALIEKTTRRYSGRESEPRSAHLSVLRGDLAVRLLKASYEDRDHYSRLLRLSTSLNVSRCAFWKGK
jgi:hypothetical protein